MPPAPDAVQVQHFTKGDRLVSIRAVLLKRSDRTPKTLTGMTLRFRMVNASTGVVKVDDAAAVVEDAAAGRVRYDWTAGDVDAAAQYWGWWIVVSGGQQESVPPGHGLKVVFHDRV